MTLKRGLLLVLLAFLPPFSAFAQSDKDTLFTVADVPVDASAQSAVQARDKALAEGQQKALRMLLERITAKQYWNQLPKVSDSQLADLILDFEVTSERTSAVRYVGTLTFRFRPDAVRKVLAEAHIPFTEARSKAVVVLPVYEQGARATLWDAPNPWRAAWSRQPLADGLVPMQVPPGELPDVQAIDAGEASSGDRNALSAISRRYDDADVLVARAVLSGAGDQRILQVTAVRYAAGYPTQNWSEAVRANPGERDADLLSRGVAAVIGDVTGAWSKAAEAKPGSEAVLVATVPLGSLDDWVRVRELLRSVPAIRRSSLLSLSRDGARVEIRYQGEAEQLQALLAQRDLVLARGDPDWTLTPGRAPGR